MNRQRLTAPANAIWLFLVTVIGGLLLPVCQAGAAWLLPVAEQAKEHGLRIALLHRALPAAVVGLALGLLASLAGKRKKMALATVPAGLLLLLFLLFQGRLYQVEWTATFVLTEFVPTAAALLGMSVLAGAAAAAVVAWKKRRHQRPAGNRPGSSGRRKVAAHA
jgi:hypothetical protein